MPISYNRQPHINTETHGKCANCLSNIIFDIYRASVTTDELHLEIVRFRYVAGRSHYKHGCTRKRNKTRAASATKRDEKTKEARKRERPSAHECTERENTRQRRDKRRKEGKKREENRGPKHAYSFPINDSSLVIYEPLIRGWTSRWTV